jgi:hypothetical protein
MAQSKKRYVFEPVGWDIFDRRAHQPEPGTIVVKTQPFGAPKNGTMGHCFVEDAETGEFYGLVLVNSLQPVR